MGMAAAHREGCALLMVMVMVLVLAPAMAPAMIIVLVPAMAMAPALVRWLRVGVRYVTMRCVVRTAARCCSVLAVVGCIAALSFAALCAEAGQGSCSRLLLMVMMPFE
jgi:hypothetical protein